MTWLSYNNIINNRLDLLIIIITIIRRADKFKEKSFWSINAYA